MRRYYTTNYILYLMVSDTVLTLVSLYLAYVIRIDAPFGVSLGPQNIHLPGFLYVAAALIWGIIFILVDVYDSGKTLYVQEEVQRVLLAVGIAALTLAGTLYMTARDLPRLLFVYFVLVDASLLLLYRLSLRLAFHYVGPRLRDTERVLIVGAGALGREVARRLKDLEWTGLDLVGFVDDVRGKQGGQMEGAPILGRMQDIVHVVRRHRIDEVIVALPLRSQGALAETIRRLHFLPVRIRVVPDVMDLAIFNATIDDLDGIPLIGLRDPAIDGFDRLVKRALDILIASLTLALTWPLMVLIAVAIKVSSPNGPILFKQKRTGENGRLFWMYKFRTMIPDADKQLHKVMRTLPDGSVVYKHKDDPRVLPIGRILRRLSLDELPQLFNVLKGEMSLVGPRPEIPEMLQYYEPWQWKRFSVPPGITGWWQVSGRADKPMHLNTEYDLYYIQHYSPFLDLQILWRTIGAVLRGKGAY